MSDIPPQSPDLRQLVDLTLYDSSITDLIAQMQLDAPMKLPGWAPTTADPAETFLETNALCTAFLAFAINRVPGAVTQILLTLFGVYRNLGVQATATVTITAIGAGGYTVPAGTRLGLAQSSGPSLAFVTSTALSIPAGSNSAVVPIIASAVGAGPNGTQAGVALSILDPINYLISAVLATPVGGGADPESNTAWLTRGIQALGRLVNSLVLPSQFVQAALATVGPFRVLALQNYNPATAVGTVTLGYMTLAVMGQGGVALSSAAKSQLQALLQAQSVANLIVSVIDATLNTINVTATVNILAGYSPGAVQAAVEAALSAYLDPDSWAWVESTVRYNSLIAVIENVAGVDWCSSLQISLDSGAMGTSDLVLSGAGPLATVGVLGINVPA